MSKPENDLQGYPAEFTEFMSGKCRAQVRRFVAVALRVRKAGKGFREFRRQIGNYAKKYGRKFYWLWTSAITYARLKKAGLPVQKSKPLSPEQQQIRRDVLKQVFCLSRNWNLPSRELAAILSRRNHHASYTPALHS